MAKKIYCIRYIRGAGWRDVRHYLRLGGAPGWSTECNPLYVFTSPSRYACIAYLHKVAPEYFPRVAEIVEVPDAT